MEIKNSKLETSFAFQTSTNDRFEVFFNENEGLNLRNNNGLNFEKVSSFFDRYKTHKEKNRKRIWQTGGLVSFSLNVSCSTAVVSY